MYLIATLANDADYMPALTHLLGRELPEPDARDGAWGIGYYADDRALIMRRPMDAETEVGIDTMTQDLHSHIVVASGSSGGTNLYRFRRWLFAGSGDLQPLEAMRDTIREKLPDFLATEFGEGNGAALAFAMFLSALRKAGGLDDPLFSVPDTRLVMAKTVDTIRGLSSEAQDGPVKAAYVATNGRCIVSAGSGLPVYLKTQAGLEALPEGPVDPARTDFKAVAEALRRFRAVVLAHQEGQRGTWERLADGMTIAIDGQLNLLTGND